MSILIGDLIQNIMMHLRPRFLYILMQTNKTVLGKIKTNKEYFQRLALHARLRYVDFDGNLPIYRSMTNLTLGYNASMNDFANKVRIFLENEFGCRTTNWEETIAQYNEIARRLTPDTEEDVSEADQMFIKKHKKYHDHLYPFEHDVTDYISNIKSDYEYEEIKLIANSIDDDSVLTIAQKKAIAKSIMTAFEFNANNHLDAILNPRNAEEANDIVRHIAMGFFREFLKKANNYTSVISKLENWINLFSTSEAFAQIPFPIRHRIMKAVWTTVMEKITYEFPEDNSDTSSFFVKWNINKGQAVIDVEKFTKTFKINTV